MVDVFGAGVAIGKASIKDLQTFEEAEQSHREKYQYPTAKINSHFSYKIPQLATSHTSLTIV